MPARYVAPTPAQLGARASYCDLMEWAEIAADLRALGRVVSLMQAAILPDSGVSDRELVGQLWGAIDGWAPA